MNHCNDNSPKTQAITFLKVLGCKPTDKIWVRLLAGKGYDVVADNLYPKDGYLTLKDDCSDFKWTQVVKNKVTNQWEERPPYPDGFRWLSQTNNRGYGVYVIPNKGGRQDADIKSYSHHFVDFDGTDTDTKEHHLERLAAFPLQPSMVIETRRGYHAYWQLNDPETPIERFTEIQHRFIKALSSDPSIFNEARLMRFPGFNHMAKGQDPMMVEIKNVNDSKYTQENFDEVLPKLKVYHKTAKTVNRNVFDKKNDTHSVSVTSIYTGIPCESQAISTEGFNHDLAVQFKNVGVDHESLHFKDIRYILLWVPEVSFNPQTLKGNIPSENPQGSKTVGFFWLEPSILPNSETSIIFADSVKESKDYYQHLYQRAVNNGMPENNRHRKNLTEYLESKKLNTDESFHKHDVLKVESKYFDLEQTKDFILETTDNLKYIIRLLVKGGLGTGKTQLINRVADWLKKLGLIKKRIFFTSRNTISQQQAEKNGYIHLQRSKQKLTNPEKYAYANDETTDVCCCFDSITYFTYETLTRKDVLIIIDEIDSVLTKLTTKGNMECHIEKMTRIFEKSNFVAMDGMLNNRDADLITVLSDSPLSVIHNTYVKPKGLKLIQKGLQITAKIIRLLKEGKKIYLPSDSKKYLSSLHKILTELGYKCILITTDTLYREEVNAFLDNPDEAIKANQYDIVLTSPTVESGVSIDTENYFNEVIGYFIGVIPINSVYQMLKRVRDENINVSCFIKDKGNFTTCLMHHYLDDAARWLINDYKKEINKARIKDENYLTDWLQANGYDEYGIQFLYQELNISNTSLENQATALVEYIATKKAMCPTSKYANELKTIDDFERYNYKECFLKCLELNGYFFDGFSEDEDEKETKESNKILKETNKELKEYDIEQTMIHDTLPINELHEYENKSLTPTERYLKDNATKRDIFNLSPGNPLINNREFWAKALNEPDFNSTCYTLLYYENPDMTKNQKTEDILPKDKPQYAMKINLHKVYSNKDKALILRECQALTKLLSNENTLITSDTPEIDDIISYLQDEQYYLPLGYPKNPKPKDKVQWFSWLLKRIGYRIEKVKQKGTGKRERLYKILKPTDLVRKIVDSLKLEKESQGINPHVESVEFTDSEKLEFKTNPENFFKGDNTILYHDVECEIISSLIMDKPDNKELNGKPAILIKALHTSNKISLSKNQNEIIYSLNNCQKIINPKPKYLDYQAITDEVIDDIIEGKDINNKSNGLELIKNLTNHALTLFDVYSLENDPNFDGILDLFNERITKIE